MFNAMTRHGTTSSNYSLLVRLNIRRCADEKNQAEIAFGNVRQPCFFSRATFVFKKRTRCTAGTFLVSLYSSLSWYEEWLQQRLFIRGRGHQVRTKEAFISPEKTGPSPLESSAALSFSTEPAALSHIPPCLIK